MVWERNSTAIVMLTGIIESGVEKSEQYWPTDVNSPVQYGNISVKILSNTSNADWSKMEILLKKVSLNLFSLS